MIAALQGDLDTSDAVGKVFFRQDSSPHILRQAAEHINRAFPEDDEVSPTHAVVITWVDITSNEPQSSGDGIDKRVSVTQLFKLPGMELVIYILSNVLLHRETPSNWLLHPWRPPHMLSFCIQGMGYNLPPRL